MSSDPPELGKGLFGYRKSAVNQIIADRDIMLRQAEGRVRAAESKVADLETELGGMRDRNTRMDEQIERLRQQLDALTRSAGIPPAEQPPASEAPPAPTAWEEEPDQAIEAAVDTYTEEPATRGHEEPAIPSYDEAPTPAYEEQQLTPAFGEAHSPAVYGDEESLEAEGDWPAAEQDWPGSEQATPMVAADAGTTAGTSVEDDLTYGDEVQLGEDTASETSEPTWMQTGTSGQDQDEHDEVAMAGGGYRYGDYGSQPEEPGYTDYVSPEEGEQEEAPSPFSRFPFASEPFDHAGEEVAPVPEGAYQEEEPAAYVPPMESETAPAAEQPRADAPEHAAAAPERASAVSQETSDITNRFLTEELSGILSAAEESASRIVERARATTQRQIARSNRVWREVQAEVARFASWREEVEPVIRAVQTKVEGVRTEIEEVPERIRQALAPMADSISSIDGDLADLAAACNPPLLLAPGGLESEDADHSSWGNDAADDEGFESHAESSEGAFDESFGGTYEEREGDEGSGHLHAG